MTHLDIIRGATKAAPTAEAVARLKTTDAMPYADLSEWTDPLSKIIVALLEKGLQSVNELGHRTGLWASVVGKALIDAPNSIQQAIYLYPIGGTGGVSLDQAIADGSTATFYYIGIPEGKCDSELGAYALDKRVEHLQRERAEFG